MPGFWTHILAGEQIIDKIDRTSLLDIIEEDRKFYNFGCQGPDFLYFNNFWPWIKNKDGNIAGGKLHTQKIKSLFLYSSDYIKNKKGNKFYEPLLAYFYGFITHYIIDRVFHEYICQIAETVEEHVSLEIKLDEYLVKKIWGKEAIILDPLKQVNIGRTLPVFIENYFKKILVKIYDYNVEKLKFIDKSYRDFKLALWILYSPAYLKVKRIGLNIVNYFLKWDIKKMIYSQTRNTELLNENITARFDRLLIRATELGDMFLPVIDRYIKNQIDKNELRYLYFEFKKEFKAEQVSIEEIAQIPEL